MNTKPNRFGCRPRGDVCMQHEEPLICKHGCEQAPLHKCPEMLERAIADQERAECAKLCEVTGGKLGHAGLYQAEHIANACAEAIRARGRK